MDTKPLKVLYMHGIEGSPEGVKVKWLKSAGFKVLAPDMRQAICHTKSVKNPRIWIIAVILSSYFGIDVYLLYKAWCRSWASFVAGLIGSMGVVILALRQALGQYQASVRTLESRCAEIQAKALKEFQPDVVIASSWGGNICLRLMNEGVWAGPTLLLAPAQGVVAQQSGVDAHTLPRELKSPVHIIHGTADTKVIYMHSTKLAASTKSHNRVTFHLHKGDDHVLSKTLTGSDSMKKVVLELVKDINTATV